MFSLPAPTQGHARLAGLLYLLIIVLGIGSEAFIRGPIQVPGDAAATAANVLANEGLFRIGIYADALMAMADVGLGVLLFVLLWRTGPVLALGAGLFRLVQAAIIGLNLLQPLQALALLSGPIGLDPAQAEVLGALMLDAHGAGYDLGLLFFGVNSVLTGILLWKSETFPGLLGVALAAAGAVYLVGSSLVVLAPSLSGTFSFAYLVPVIAESAFCLYLLVRGLPTRRADLSAPSPSLA